jgi:hypothetical protein
MEREGGRKRGERERNEKIKIKTFTTRINSYPGHIVYSACESP